MKCAILQLHSHSRTNANKELVFHLIDEILDCMPKKVVNIYIYIEIQCYMSKIALMYL